MKQKLTLFTAFLVMPMMIFSQAAQFNTEWLNKFQHTTTDNYSNEGSQIINNPNNGDIYVLCDVTSDLDTVGNFTGTPANYVVLMHYDSSGTLLNTVARSVGQHSINGFDQKSGFGLERDNSGNIYIAYNVMNGPTGFDVRVSKFNSQLNPLWNYTYTGNTNDFGIKMKVTTTGAAVVLFNAFSSSGSGRPRIMRANAAGSSSSAYYVFPFATDQYADMVLDVDNNIYVTGYRPVTGAGKVIVVASVSGAGASGSLRWVKTDNCGSVNGDDFARSIAYDPVADGGAIYITGSSTGSQLHGIDVVTMRFVAGNGKKVWDNFINFTLTDGGYMVKVANAASIYVGWIAGNTVYVDQISTYTGTMVKRSNYVVAPSAIHTSITGLNIKDMEISNNKNVYVTGTVTAEAGVNSFNAPYLVKFIFTTRGNPVIGNVLPVEGEFLVSRSAVGIVLDERSRAVRMMVDVAENHSSHQQEKVEISSQLGSGSLRLSNDGGSLLNEVQVYPNPAHDFISINSANPILSLTISNTIGSDVKVMNFDSGAKTNSTTVDLVSLPAGIYFVIATTTEGKMKPVKFIKQ